MDAPSCPRLQGPFTSRRKTSITSTGFSNLNSAAIITMLPVTEIKIPARFLLLSKQVILLFGPPPLLVQHFRHQPRQQKNAQNDPVPCNSTNSCSFWGNRHISPLLQRRLHFWMKKARLWSKAYSMISKIDTSVNQIGMQWTTRWQYFKNLCHAKVSRRFWAQRNNWRRR